MLFCLIGYNYSEPTNYLFVFISLIFIGIFIYSLRYWPSQEQIDKSKLNDEGIIDYDVLGQEVKVYIEKTDSFKPMKVNWIKTVFLFVLGFIAFALVYASAERVEAIPYLSRGYWGSEQIIFEKGKEIKLEESASCYFCTDFEKNDVPKLNLENLKKPTFTYINEPYVEGNVTKKP